MLLCRLNRPERLNAVTFEMYQALERAFADTAADPSVRVAVITGAGRAFCVGADLTNHRARDQHTAPVEYIRAGQAANLAIQRFPKPVIAAMNGHAIGAGLELALSCDFLIVATQAKLRFPELGLGTFVGGGAVYTLAQRVGFARARELLLLGEFILAADAVEMGLVSRATESSDVLPEAVTLAKKLATKAPTSVSLLKHAMEQARYVGVEEAMALEEAALAKCMRTKDWKEGVEAFHEKREPRFIGE